MSSNRSDILTQLASGQISADQAAEQLREPSTPPEPQQPPQPPSPAKPAAPGRWLRVRVSDLATGRQRVSVNLPLSWLPIGLRLGAHFAPEVAALDLNELLAALQSGISGPLVDVEDLDDGQRVQVFVE